MADRTVTRVSTLHCDGIPAFYGVDAANDFDYVCGSWCMPGLTRPTAASR